ncbi:MAG: AsmA-like C-terminal region-containing protein, partial [bacterium]
MARIGLLRRIIRRIQILFALVLVLVAGLAVGAFFYVQDGDYFRQQIIAQAPQFFPSSRLEIAHARIRPLLGECVLEHMRLWQTLPAETASLPDSGKPASEKTTADTGQKTPATAPEDAKPKVPAATKAVPVPTLRLPFIRLVFDPWSLFQESWTVDKIVVAQPTLRLERNANGQWNLQSLFASPVPLKSSGRIPAIQISRGTLELVQHTLGETPKEPREQAPPAVLRDVELTIEPTTNSQVLKFSGSAQGTWAQRVQIQGTANLETGTVDLGGSVIGLDAGPRMISDVRPELSAEWLRLGLDDVQCNLYLESATLQLSKGLVKPASYRVRADVLRGRLQRTELPFPLSDIRGTLVVKDDQLLIERAEAVHGKTILRATGKSGAMNWRTDPLDLTLSAVNLPIDQRLQRVTPPQWQNFWVEYLPRGELNLAIRMVRNRPGGEIGFGVNADCRDVAICYEFFPYPLEHIWGQITWSGDTIRLGNPDKPPLESGLRTLLGNRPAAITGTIRKPGPRAEVDLRFEAENIGVDETLLNALPPDTRRVVDAFQPTGEVRAKAHITRQPPTLPGEPPIGKLEVHTTIDLMERCSIRWAGMPYPVSNLKGTLNLHPDYWVFENISGTNGTARISGKGRVERIGPRKSPQAPFPRRRSQPPAADASEIKHHELAQQRNQGQPAASAPSNPTPLRTHIELHADQLPFDDQLRQSLPNVWKTTWATINPIGSAHVDVLIDLDPSAQVDNRVITIKPDAETRLNLVIERRAAANNAPAKPLELPLDHVEGNFVSTNGKVAMNDVQFLFRNSQVSMQQGQVVLEKDGKFDLWAKALEARELRLDAGLRQKMPPVMAHFARRLDDGRAITFRTDMRLGWSGNSAEPAWCRWQNGIVVLNGNSFDAGWMLNNLQGQVENISGIYDGRDFTCDGVLALDNMTLKGFPIQHISAPVHVEKGLVELPSMQAMIMGGQAYGSMNVQIDQEPQYQASLKLVGVDLAQYARTVPGPQNIRGRVSGQIDLEGRGTETRNLKGAGSAEITQGDLGELPDFLRFVKALNLSPTTKTAFDSAQVGFQIDHGVTNFKPIKFQGDAFSLDGDGEMSPRG